jgi:hypothetical protein
MSGTKKPEGKRLVIGPGRMSWPEIITPRETPNGNRWSVTLLLPPDYDLDPIREALEDICKQTWGTNPARWPSTARKPDQVIRDCGEKPQYGGYEPGWHFLAATTAEQPGVVDGALNPVELTPKEIYAGRWAKISCRPYIYTKMGLGVSLGLSNIQVLKHDAVFGRTSASHDFDAVVEEMSQDF